jgi:hypothetical protein
MPLFAHPDNVCMSYTQHCKLSIKLALLMLLGSIKAFIHAFIPDLCITSTSDINKQISIILKKHGCHKKSQPNDSTNDKDEDGFLILE